jgi:hypothetical protein
MLQIGAGVAGAAFYGASGAAWGLAIAQVVAALVWWHEAWKAAREAERAVSAGGLAVSPSLDRVSADTGLS